MLLGIAFKVFFVELLITVCLAVIKACTSCTHCGRCALSLAVESILYAL